MPTGTTSTSPMAPVHIVSTTIDSMPARAGDGLPLRDRVPSRKTSKNCCCRNNSSVYYNNDETGKWSGEYRKGVCQTNEKIIHVKVAVFLVKM